MRYITGKNRRREVALQGALLDRMAARFERSMAKQLAAAYRAGIKQFEKDGNAYGIDLAIDPYEEKITALIGSEARMIIRTFGERISGQAPTQKDVNGDFFEAALRDYIRNYGAQHAKYIAGTSKEHLRKMIFAGIEEGLGTEAIARNMQKQVLGLSRYRAATIARTETHTAANVGSQAAAEATGLSLIKEWGAAQDERTRETHAEADGQQVSIDGLFSVGGYDLRFPGDPSGPAEEVINCRCVQLFLAAD
jgi:uncharacterized protein with gpF-like domain